MSDTELGIGAQERAARTLLDAMGPVQSILADLQQEVVSAADGFQGAAALGFGEAVDAWFTAAQGIVPALNEYAQHLAAVDATMAETEAREQEAYSRFAARLEGGAPQQGGGLAGLLGGGNDS